MCVCVCVCQDTLVTIIPLAVTNRILATTTVQHEPITDGATDRDSIREPVTDETHTP